MEHQKQIINNYSNHKTNNNMNHVVLSEFCHTEIPEHLFSSNTIQYLIFSNNFICEIPNKIGNIIFLKYIDISNNPLIEINGLFKMKNLIKINLETDGSHDSFFKIYNNNVSLHFNIII